MDVLNLFMFPVAFLERIIRTIRNVDPCIRLKDYQQHKYCELHRNLVSHSSIASIQGLQTKTCDQWICFQSSVHSMEVFPPHVFQDWSFAWDSTLKILKWLAKAPMTRYCESGLARSSCLCTHCRPKSQAHVKLKVFFQGCKMNWTAPSSLGVIDWTPHSAQQDRQAPSGSCVTEMTCPGLTWARKAMFHFQLYVMRVQGRPMASLCGKCLLWNWH